MDSEEVNGADEGVKLIDEYHGPCDPVSEESSSSVEVILVAGGDVALEIAGMTLLASSSILRAASRYFAKLLQSQAFSEGEEPPSSIEPPTKRLQVEDPERFLLVCKLLHFQEVEEPADIETLAAVADICDYYLCQNALRFHVDCWCRKWQDQPQLEAEQYSQLLWVCCVFNLSDLFSTFSRHLAVNATQHELCHLRVHPGLGSLNEALQRIREDVVRSIFSTIEKSLQSLAQVELNQRYLCKGYLVCGGCHRRKPTATKKCGLCSSQDLALEYCTSSTRVHWFLQWLEYQKVWPLTERIGDSCQSFQDQLGVSEALSVLHTWWAHKFEGGIACPLEVTKRSLRANVEAQVRNARGLDLAECRPTDPS